MSRYVPKLPPLDPCPVEHAVGLTSGKWKARILGRVRERPSTVAEIQRFLPRARPQVLLQQLKALERDGLIKRLSPEPGQTWGAYALTERGSSLLNAVDAIADWGQKDLRA